MRTSFVHLADTRLGFRDPDDPEVFRKVAQQFRFAVDFAIDQRASFVVFSGQLFSNAEVEPDTLQVALRGLNQLAAKNIAAIAVRGRCEAPPPAAAAGSVAMTWHDLLAQEGLLASLEVSMGQGQLGLSRWERREGHGSFVDLGRTRVFGIPYSGSMAGVMLPALGKAVGAQDNREADFRLVLLPGILEHFSATFAPKLAYSDVLLFRRSLDYIALGGCDETYESEGWVYNPGCQGFYHVTVDTAVQPKHVARYVAYPADLRVSRPAPPSRRATVGEQEERIFNELAGSGETAAASSGTSQQRDIVRLVTQTMWGSAQTAELRASLLDAARDTAEPDRAA